jgi:hypothetical protein
LSSSSHASAALRMPISSSSFRSPCYAARVRKSEPNSRICTAGTSWNIKAFICSCFLEYLFIYRLFNHAACSSDYIASNGSVGSEWLIQNNVEESGPDLILVLLRHFPRDPQEDNERSQDNLSKDRVSNLGPFQ